MAKTKKAPEQPAKTREQEQAERLAEVGRSAMESIREMVAALECDYERRTELRDERDAWDAEEEGKPWDKANEEEAEELTLLDAAAGDCDSREDAEQRIHEDPLSLEFRSGWVSSRDEMEPEEFCLLLSTGGPAVRIIGEIRDGEAHSARLETQDWFTPWTEYITTGEDHEALLTYCRCFYFGS